MEIDNGLASTRHTDAQVRRGCCLDSFQSGCVSETYDQPCSRPDNDGPFYTQTLTKENMKYERIEELADKGSLTVERAPEGVCYIRWTCDGLGFVGHSYSQNTCVHSIRPLDPDALLERITHTAAPTCFDKLMKHPLDELNELYPFPPQPND